MLVISCRHTYTETVPCWGVRLPVSRLYMCISFNRHFGRSVEVKDETDVEEDGGNTKDEAEEEALTKRRGRKRKLKG